MEVTASAVVSTVEPLAVQANGTSIKALNWHGRAIVRTALDGKVTNNGDPIDPEFKNIKHLSTVERSVKKDLLYLKVITS